MKRQCFSTRPIATKLFANFSCSRLRADVALVVHLQRDTMLAALRVGIVQLKPPVPQLARTHRLQQELRYIPLRAVEPSILHSHAAILSHSHSRNICGDRWVRIECVGELVDGRV